MKEELLGRLAALEDEAKAKAACVTSWKETQDLKIHLLGRKGALTVILQSLSALSPTERPEVGKAANRIKQAIETLLETLGQRLQQEETARHLKEARLDVTLPGKTLLSGRIHLINQVRREIEEIFLNLGFSIFEGPEIETDYYNFGALNFPEDHPARAMQDTFYIKSQLPNSNNQTNSNHQIPKSKQLLLRTHTSPGQIRFMEKHKPPLAMIAPGTVYRRDAFDATHSPMFHQIEGLMVGENITFANLKWTLTTVCQRIFGKDRQVRFRPSFFPFTEPSAEVDIEWGDKYLEILGAGQVDPEVFKTVGLNPNRWTGFAFGMGLERIAMLKYGIADLRLFFESDLRFLEQF